MSIDKLAIARNIFFSLKGKAPPIAVREVLEAVLGLKCSRLNVRQPGLELLQSLSRSYGFGLAVSDWKVIPSVDSGKGSWSDGVVGYVPADNSEGLFAVYLAPTDAQAAMALETEALLGDEAFGKLLGIPACCRRFYLARRPRALSSGNDYLWETLSDVPCKQAVPAGANIIAQYFGRCLLSHFPCGLSCRASRHVSATRREAISGVAPELADYLAEGHHWPALVWRGRGMIAYPQALTHEAVVRPLRNSEPVAIGDIPDGFAHSDVIFTDGDGCVVAQRDGRVTGLESGSRARLVPFGNVW